MKNKLALYSICCILIVCLTFCSGCSINTEIIYDENYIFGQDSQENFIRYQGQQCIAESEDSYYFINLENGFAYIIDKTTQICQPLCAKSDCLHDRESSVDKKRNCNAWLNASNNILLYYNNNLYYQSYTESTDKDGIIHPICEINELSLDGTKQEVIYSLSDYFIWNFRIHRGYIFFTATSYDSAGSASESDATLFRISVNGKGKAEEIIPLYEYEDTNIMDTRYYGNHIFFFMDHFTSDEDNTDQYLLRYDIETGEQTNISKNLETNICSLFTIFNGKIVFANKHKIYSCDLNGENEHEILDCDELLPGFEYYTPFTNDGSNIIVSPSDNDKKSDELIFIDNEGNAKVKKMLFAFSAYMGCDKDVFIVFRNTADDNQSVWIIDKSDFSAEEVYTFM